jgi:hypothetical protein
METTNIIYILLDKLVKLSNGVEVQNASSFNQNKSFIKIEKV